MAVSFSEYMGMLAEAVSRQQGPHLAFLLRPTSPHAKDLRKEFRDPTVLHVTAHSLSWT